MSNERKDYGAQKAERTTVAKVSSSDIHGLTVNYIRPIGNGEERTINAGNEGMLGVASIEAKESTSDLDAIKEAKLTAFPSKWAMGKAADDHNHPNISVMRSADEGWVPLSWFRASERPDEGKKVL